MEHVREFTSSDRMNARIPLLRAPALTPPLLRCLTFPACP